MDKHNKAVREAFKVEANTAGKKTDKLFAIVDLLLRKVNELESRINYLEKRK